MVELLLHFTLPLTVLSYIYDFRREYKKILLISFLSILPDLDVLLCIHRSISHSIIPYTIVLAVILLLSKSSSVKLWSIVGYLAILSHLVLDLFTGLTPILWPVVPYSIFIETNIIALISTNTITPMFNVSFSIEETEFTRFTSFYAVVATSQGLAITVILLLPLILKAILAYTFRRELL
ncbi:MAG TPA: metal-dependent hydrolase [Desulfurococcales archaeon]|nr:metal-dependent hydrolase [Desulfurococcales archaeon]